MIAPPLERRHMAWLALASIVSIGILHWRILFLGHQQDVLLAVQPWTAAQLRDALAGHWLFASDDYYFRPLTALLFAADFNVFALNSRALHLESLVLLSAITWMFGCWLWIEAGPIASAAGIALYLTHPTLLDSSIAGAQYHFQLAPLACVAAILWMWSRRRHEITLRAWAPIFALALIAYSFKEDSIMVLPAVAALQWIRARYIGDAPLPSRALTASVACLAMGLFLIRRLMFPHIDTNGIFDRINLEGARILLYAPVRSAFVMFFEAKPLIGTTMFVLLLQVAGVRNARRDSMSPIGWLWTCGLVLLAAFALPLVMCSEIRTTRSYLELYAAAVMLGAGAAALLNWARVAEAFWPAAASAVLVVGLYSQWRVQQTFLETRFAPCSIEQLTANGYAATWPEITPDLRQWLAGTPAVCAAGGRPFPEDAMATIRWSNALRHVVLARRDAARVTLHFAAPAATTNVIVTIDGRREEHVLAPASTQLTLSVSPTWRTWLRRSYRIDVDGAGGSAIPALISSSIEAR